MSASYRTTQRWASIWEHGSYGLNPQVVQTLICCPAMHGGNLDNYSPLKYLIGADSRTEKKNFKKVHVKILKSESW